MNTTDVCFAAVTAAPTTFVSGVALEPTTKFNCPRESLRTISSCPAVEESGVGNTQFVVAVVELLTRIMLVDTLIGALVVPGEDVDA